MFDPNSGAAGAWAVIGGQRANEHTVNNALLNMTNKDSGGSREFLEGEGLQSIDDSAEIVFNTGASFTALQLAARSKASRRFMFTVGDLQTGPGSDMFEAMVATFADTSPNEDILTATTSLQSANDQITYGVLFNDAIDSAADDATDADGDAALAVV